MKSLFNVVAFGIDLQTAMLKAAANTFIERGRVIVDFVKDVREGLEASELPQAIRDYKKIAKGVPEAEWLGDLLTEIGKLTFSVDDAFDGKPDLNVVQSDQHH